MAAKKPSGFAIGMLSGPEATALVDMTMAVCKLCGAQFREDADILAIHSALNAVGKRAIIEAIVWSLTKNMVDLEVH